MYFLDSLCYPGSQAVAYVEGPKGYSLGVRLPSAQWWWCHVKVVLRMSDWVGEADGHPGWSLKSMSCINLRIFYSQYGPVAFRGTPHIEQWLGPFEPGSSVADSQWVVGSVPPACPHPWIYL